MWLMMIINLMNKTVYTSGSGCPSARSKDFCRGLGEGGIRSGDSLSFFVIGAGVGALGGVM